jgi:hypothetical protein
MTLQDMGSLGEAIGAVATVATLIYLAIQLRQNSASIQATAELEGSRQLAQFVSRISADSNKKRIYDLIATGAELSPEDERDYSWLLAELFHMSEGIFIQFRKGHLSTDIWNEYEQILVGFLESEIGLRWWNEVAPPFSGSFRSHIEACREEDRSWTPDSVARYERSSSDAEQQAPAADTASGKSRAGIRGLVSAHAEKAALAVFPLLLNPIRGVGQ